MKKPEPKEAEIVEQVEKKVRKKKPTFDQAFEAVEGAVKRTKELVEKYELDYYMDGSDIRGSKVDDSNEITPSEVAVLGAYTTVLHLRDELNDIKEGKEDTRAVILQTKDGNTTEIKFKDLPKQVKNELKRLMEEE